MVSHTTLTKDNELYRVILELGTVGDFLGGIPLDYFYKEVKRRGLYAWDIAIKSALKRLADRGDIIIIDFHIRQPINLKKEMATNPAEESATKFDQFAQDVRSEANGGEQL